MKIPFLPLWISILSASSIATEANNTDVNYVDPLSNECESQLQLKIAEGKLKDDLIFSKDIHIKDLQNSISELQDTNRILKQIIKSTNSNVDSQLEKFIREEFERTQNDLKNHEERIQQNELDILKLKEEIETCVEKPQNCTTYGGSNGIHNIIIPNFETFAALCNSDIAGPGWTVIQQRINGEEDFYRNWETYKNGFGNFTGDFFLGLEKIHRLTNDTPHELYIHMEGYEGGIYTNKSFYARYNKFSIAGEDDKYRLLSLGTYSGNAETSTQTDRMSYHIHRQFSTFDSVDDNYGGNCAEKRHGGWWYNRCGACNLNGKYYQTQVDRVDSNYWDSGYSLKTTKMLIHPRGIKIK